MATRGKRDRHGSAAASGWTVHEDPVAPETAPAAPTEPDAGDARSPQVDPALRDDLEPGAGVDAETGDEAALRQGTEQLSSVMLVVLGLVGGVYLLYAWVWLTWAQYYGAGNELAAAGSGSLGAVLQQTVFWIAPLAPIFWFIAALVLQRSTPVRLVWTLVIGLVVLLPLPMLLDQGVAFA